MRDVSDAVDLASERVGGVAIDANDELFAPKENLLRAAAPVFRDEYTERGHWMDGWETRRKRVPGHDWCVVRLGLPGRLRAVDVNTAFFRGNFPERCRIEGCVMPPETPADGLGDDAPWVELLAESPLKGDSNNLFEVTSPYAVTHVRLSIFPDGGVARLRVYGDVLPDWERRGGLDGEVDLAAIENGGRVLACSDMFFGSRHNIIMPGRAANMGDGWETRRRRGPGHDWLVVRLGAEGVVTRAEVDTNHFVGNYPESFSLEACSAPGEDAASWQAEGVVWHELIARTKLQPTTRHVFAIPGGGPGDLTHARLRIYPDGGVSRLRLFGRVSDAGRVRQGLARLNALPPPTAERELAACCGASAWARAMSAARPFASLDALAERADRVWSSLAEADWRQAFAQHPRIGETKAAAGVHAYAATWSVQEQAAASGVAGVTASALAETNRAYEARFGHVFLVCATGKSADEMLAIARSRLDNAPHDELAIAAGEQAKITRLRLARLVSRWA